VSLRHPVVVCTYNVVISQNFQCQWLRPSARMYFGGGSQQKVFLSRHKFPDDDNDCFYYCSEKKESSNCMGNSNAFSNSSLDVVSGLVKFALPLFALALFALPLFALPFFLQVMKTENSHVYLASLVSRSYLGSQHPQFSLPPLPSPPFFLSLCFLSLSLSLLVWKNTHDHYEYFHEYFKK